MLTIDALAQSLGLSNDEYEPYGRAIAKLSLSALATRRGGPQGKLVLVTAITPTPAGEGKTTTTIGLTMGLNRIGVKAVAALREPSLGPVFGMKGGATGGGKAVIGPSDAINLHFTGDLHAITAANNLLAALTDNYLLSGNERRLDSRTVSFQRCLDMNDRALRKCLTGLGGKSEGIPRETGFEITAASEVMATLCLAEGFADLKARLGRIVVGTDENNEQVTAGDIQAVGGMAVLLKDALKPNLVQTAEGNPVIVHGGPFANIAHGCNSVIATRLALALGDVCVTEAGFGADLGAEKFLDIKMRQAGLAPDLVVLVATLRALKMHGGVALADLNQENVAAMEAGFANLARHAENLKKFGLPVVVAINRFPTDTPAEEDALARLCDTHGLPVALSSVFGDGGAGGVALAELVQATLAKGEAQFAPLYADTLPLRKKIETVAKEIYRAESVEFLPAAKTRLGYLTKRGFGNLPVCIAKTQYSFSDDPTQLNAPTGHTLTIRDAKLSAGAGFVVAYAGQLLTMPGLPKKPASLEMDLTDDGEIIGVS